MGNSSNKQRHPSTNKQSRKHTLLENQHQLDLQSSDNSSLPFQDNDQNSNPQQPVRCSHMDRMFHESVLKFFKDWKTQKQIEFNELQSGTVTTSMLGERATTNYDSMDRKKNCCIKANQRSSWLTDLRLKISMNSDIKNRDAYLSFLDKLKDISKDKENRLFTEYISSINLDKNLKLLKKQKASGLDIKNIEQRQAKSSKQDNHYLPNWNTSTANVISTGFTSMLPIDIQQLNLMKRQLDLQDHPIHKIINFIRGIFVLQYRNLLLHGISDRDLKSDDQNITVSLKQIIQAIAEAVSKFYLLDFIETSQLWNEILEVIVTSMIIKGDLYALIINIIQLSHQEEIKALDNLMRNKVLLLSDIKIDKKFQLNIHDREFKVIDIDEVGSGGLDQNLVIKEDELEQQNTQPYQQTIRLLQSLKYQMTIPQKLDTIHSALKTQLGQDIDDFWNGYQCKQQSVYSSYKVQSLRQTYKSNNGKDIQGPTSNSIIHQKPAIQAKQHLQTFVDFEKLQQLSLYVVWATQYPELFSECLFIKRYINNTLNQGMRGFFSRLLEACVNVMFFLIIFYLILFYMLTSGNQIQSYPESLDHQILELSAQDIENLQNSLLQKEKLMPLFDINLMAQTILPRTKHTTLTGQPSSPGNTNRRVSNANSETYYDLNERQIEIALEFEKLIFQQALFLHDDSRHFIIINQNHVSMITQEINYDQSRQKKKTTVLCSSEGSFINTLKHLKSQINQQALQEEPDVQQIYNFTGDSFIDREQQESLENQNRNFNQIEIDDINQIQEITNTIKTNEIKSNKQEDGQIVIQQE